MFHILYISVFTSILGWIDRPGQQFKSVQVGDSTIASCQHRDKTKRNTRYQRGTLKSHSRQTTAEFTAKLPKIISVCRTANPLRSRDCILSLLALGILHVSISSTASAPDSSHTPRRPGISTSDSGYDIDTRNVLNDSPELNRSRRCHIDYRLIYW